jgi:phosphotriesterase-related protein
MGCGTFVDCTPEYLGKDPLILKALSDSTGLNILTNTGYYGAYDNKYIPGSDLALSAEELSEKWTRDWEKGIGDSGIKPGFIKIAVNRDSLSDFHSRLVKAAALTHLKTGLTIASHTGPALPAFQELEILKSEGVSPGAFIWVHAHSEKDLSKLVQAAEMGAWVSLDKLNDDNVDEILSIMKYIKEKGFINKILVSHDAGWYDPAKPNGGEFRGYNTMFEKLIPAMKENGFEGEEIEQVFVINPAEAYSVKVRKL